MSIIVFGPQGCGKTRNAEKLREYFGMEKVEDSDDPYPHSLRKLAEFKAGKTLFLTCQPPPRIFDGSRRIHSFEYAMENIAHERKYEV